MSLCNKHEDLDFNAIKLELQKFKDITFDNLTVGEKVERINQLIEEMGDCRNINICRYCRASVGDLKVYNPYFEDGSVCDICHGYHDVINYSIVELMEKAGLDYRDYLGYNKKDNENYRGIRISGNTRDKIDKFDALEMLKAKEERTKSVADFELVYFLEKYHHRKVRLNMFQRFFNRYFVKL